jgi:phenylacetate-CoA ligase
MMGLRRTLASRVSLPFFWNVVKRYPVLEQLSEWRERQWDDRAIFEDRQTRALGDLLSHAVARVPYYSERAGGLTPGAAASAPGDSLAMLPVLEKRNLIRDAEALTCEMARGSYWNSTGGSTGEPVRFRQDRVYQTNAVASTMLFYEWAGVPQGASHMRLWGAPRDLGHGGVARRRRLADWLFNRTTLDAFEMSERTMRRYAESIARRQPACLEGYADALYELAVHVERLGLPMPAPGAIVSSAGALLPHMREKIESAFGAEVFDRYGAREVSGIAAECDRHEGLHVFGETTVVEVVDGDGREVGDGEEGDVLVTNLYNYTMPLIRYRIGDRAVRSAGRCSCGRPYPLLLRVVGRSESCVHRPDGGIVPSEFFIHVIGVEYNDGSIGKFQVVQEALDSLTVVIVPSEGTGERALAREDEMRARIQQMVGDCEIRFVLADRIDPTRTGKHMYVVNRMEEHE